MLSNLLYAAATASISNRHASSKIPAGAAPLATPTRPGFMNVNRRMVSATARKAAKIIGQPPRHHGLLSASRVRRLSTRREQPRVPRGPHLRLLGPTPAQWHLR